jgi:hypothetical protein
MDHGGVIIMTLINGDSLYNYTEYHLTAEFSGVTVLKKNLEETLQVCLRYVERLFEGVFDRSTTQNFAQDSLYLSYSCSHCVHQVIVYAKYPQSVIEQ